MCEPRHHTRDIAGRLGRLRPRHGRRGFSLVEILVALAVFALGMAGILALFGAATMTAGDTFDTIEVQGLIDEIAADIQANFSRYAPPNYPDNLYGYPQQWLNENGGNAPATAAAIRIPPGWPGYREIVDIDYIDEDSRVHTTLRQPLTYAITFAPLTNTTSPLTGRPQCVVATITVYWTREGSTFSIESPRVILLPESPPS